MRNEDLRIGNLVNGLYEDGDGKTLSTVCKVLAVDSTESLGDGWGALLLSVDELEIDEFTDYNPIPLTEDWLKRFGFEQGALGSWIKSITVFGNLRELSFGGDYLYLREGKEVYGSGEDDLCVLWNKDVMKQFYVHQLQNLYFALTGEELKLN